MVRYASWASGGGWIGGWHGTRRPPESADRYAPLDRIAWVGRWAPGHGCGCVGVASLTARTRTHPTTKLPQSAAARTRGLDATLSARAPAVTEMEHPAGRVRHGSAPWMARQRRTCPGRDRAREGGPAALRGVTAGAPRRQRLSALSFLAWCPYRTGVHAAVNGIMGACPCCRAHVAAAPPCAVAGVARAKEEGRRRWIWSSLFTWFRHVRKPVQVCSWGWAACTSCADMLALSWSTEQSC
jgi:hypothetical protein